MKKVKESRKRGSVKRPRLLTIVVLAIGLLATGAVAAVAKYESARFPRTQPAAEKAPANFVTVEVGGKRIQVAAATLQQGPLTPEQSQQIANALQNNKSTDGLVQVQHADGTVEMDLQDRFQNVVLAKKNDDGSISQACVDTPEAAKAFLQNTETKSAPENRPRKAALQ